MKNSNCCDLDWVNCFVGVIGLNAVQFENNWMTKILKTSKLDRAVGQFGSPRNFLS